MQVRTLGFATAGLVIGFVAFFIVGNAVWGHATQEQVSGMVWEVVGIWGMPLILLAVNKIRGKAAGGWTIFFTCWSWVSFAFYIVAPFVKGFVTGLSG